MLLNTTSFLRHLSSFIYISCESLSFICCIYLLKLQLFLEYQDMSETKLVCILRSLQLTFLREGNEWTSCCYLPCCARAIYIFLSLSFIIKKEKRVYIRISSLFWYVSSGCLCQDGQIGGEKIIVIIFPLVLIYSLVTIKLFVFR